MKNKILVVDDNPDLLEVISIFLGGEGYDVVAVGSGAEALEKFDDTFDLVILDVMMPGISGYKVCSEIREKSFVPILFLPPRLLTRIKRWVFPREETTTCQSLFPIMSFSHV